MKIQDEWAKLPEWVKKITKENVEGVDNPTEPIESGEFTIIKEGENETMPEV